MNTFDKLISELALASGLPFETDQNHSFTQMSDGLLFNRKQRNEPNDTVICSLVTGPDKITALNDILLRQTLRLSLSGKGTDVNYLRLFGADQIPSAMVRTDKITVPQPAEKIFGVKKSAAEVRFLQLNSYAQTVPHKEENLLQEFLDIQD